MIAKKSASHRFLDVPSLLYVSNGDRFCHVRQRVLWHLHCWNSHVRPVLMVTPPSHEVERDLHVAGRLLWHVLGFSAPWLLTVWLLGVFIKKKKKVLCRSMLRRCSEITVFDTSQGIFLDVSCRHAFFVNCRIHVISSSILTGRSATTPMLWVDEIRFLWIPLLTGFLLLQVFHVCSSANFRDMSWK